MSPPGMPEARGAGPARPGWLNRHVMLAGHKALRRLLRAAIRRPRLRSVLAAEALPVARALLAEPAAAAALAQALAPDRGAGTHNVEVRERWLQQTLAALPAGSRILDAGAGELQYRKFCTHLTYVSQDLGAYDGQGDAKGLQQQQWNTAGVDIISDIASIPVPAASFDAVMCIEVLEHVPEPSRALAEFARILRPGGHLIVTAPFCSLTHFAPYHFATGFSAYWYRTLLTAYGFTIEDLQTNGNYFEYLAQELRRLPKVTDANAALFSTPEARLAIQWLLNNLAEASTRDPASNELLHFGCHVRAQRTLPVATQEPLPAGAPGRGHGAGNKGFGGADARTPA